MNIELYDDHGGSIHAHPKIQNETEIVVGLLPYHIFYI